MTKRAMTGRKTTLAELDRDRFDFEFWSSIPRRERLHLVWEMVLEDLAWRHPDAPEPRLQRSVCRVER